METKMKQHTYEKATKLLDEIEHTKNILKKFKTSRQDGLDIQIEIKNNIKILLSDPLKSIIEKEILNYIKEMEKEFNNL